MTCTRPGALIAHAQRTKILRNMLFVWNADLIGARHVLGEVLIVGGSASCITTVASRLTSTVASSTALAKPLGSTAITRHPLPPHFRARPHPVDQEKRARIASAVEGLPINQTSAPPPAVTITNVKFLRSFISAFKPPPLVAVVGVTSAEMPAGRLLSAALIEKIAVSSAAAPLSRASVYSTLGAE